MRLLSSRFRLVDIIIREAPLTCAALIGLVCLDGCTRQAAVSPDIQAEIDRVHRLETSARAAGVPSQEQVEILEAQFAAEPCIGDAERWERTYFFGTTKARDAVDKDRIDFRLREAGKYGFRSERRTVGAMSREAMPDIDDRDYEVAFGSFRVSDRTLMVESCGPNIS